MPRPFLTARWTNLALLTYAVDPALLAPVVPAGLELDTHPQWPGRGLVSLVAFDFQDCAVLDLRWRIPGTHLVNFPEVNLRFYVRTPGATHAPSTRGVCFIKELVPSRLVSLAARWVYNEPYFAARMRSRTQVRDAQRTVEHHFTSPRGIDHALRVTADDQPFTPPPDSVEHFFKEHDWGFGRDRRGRTLTYRVEHPIWRVYPIQNVHSPVNFGAIYGSQWAFLASQQPVSTVLAEGSHVAVFPCGTRTPEATATRHLPTNRSA